MTRENVSKIRRYGFPSEVNEPFWLFADDAALKAHPRYREAKAGDIEAAVELVADVALDFLVSIKEKLPADAIYIAPHAREATGDNTIPQVLATAAAIVAQGEVETDIVQVTRVFHTGADPMERMCLRPEFDGHVIAGGRYVLVDDVTSMGGYACRAFKLSAMLWRQGRCRACSGQCRESKALPPGSKGSSRTGKEILT